MARSKRPISVIAAVVRRTGSLTAGPGQGLECGSGAQSRTVGEASAIRHHRQIMADRGRCEARGKGLLCAQGIEVHGRWWQPKGWQEVNVEKKGIGPIRGEKGDCVQTKGTGPMRGETRKLCEPTLGPQYIILTGLWAHDPMKPVLSFYERACHRSAIAL